jgi:aryl-alcohol dehydrogenase-like predicted oxidoreductase
MRTSAAQSRDGRSSASIVTEREPGARTISPGTPPLARLGQTGLVVSRIGLGLAALGRPAYMAPGRDADLGGDRSVAAMACRCRTMLDAAYAAGIRYLDAARSYGLAEEFVRTWCDARALPATALTVGSKWGYIYTGGWRLDAPIHEVKRLSIDTLRRQTVESVNNLGERLSLYQIHSATLESGVLDDAAVLTELVRLRGGGRCIGLTVTGPGQADMICRALDVHVDGVRLFQTVQATWNLLEPSAGLALAAARAEGCGVIVKEVLANGRLTNRHAAPRLRQLQSYAASRGTTLETLAVAAALAQPWADVVLSGAVTRDQLQGSLDALGLGIDCPSPVGVAEAPDSYWRQRATLAWS